jgi:hypothetical protein
MYTKDEDRSLKTQDIPTAQPTYHHLKYLNKPDLAVGSTDPEHVGARARTYYAPMDRRVRDLNLTTADIELAQPRSHKHKGNRHTDPICPNYDLPSSYTRAPTPPRFNGRHTNDISDIELSCPKKLIPDRNYNRDPNESRDIEYASANYHERMARRTMNRPREDRQHDVRDITANKGRQTRSSCPLDPEYSVPTHATTSLHTLFSEEKGSGVEHAPKEAARIGHVHGSKPRKLQWDNGEPHFSLLREDIAGTVPQRWIGSVPANIYDPPHVRPMISFHDPHDIPGAQVGSLKKGIEGVTSRVLDPLNPKYPMLDGDGGRPQPMPILMAERGHQTAALEAERGHPRQGMGSHPSLQKNHQQMQQSGSAPDLRRPPPSGGSGRGMQREASAGQLLRQGGHAGIAPSGGVNDGYRSGPPSRMMTPASQRGGGQYQQQQQPHGNHYQQPPPQQNYHHQPPQNMHGCDDAVGNTIRFEDQGQQQYAQQQQQQYAQQQQQQYSPMSSHRGGGGQMSRRSSGRNTPSGHY